jgi:glycosyltransferase involved in cell wall biosynthesis
MRILIVSQYFWPEDFRINELTQSLVENGAQVDVLTGKPNYPEGVVQPGYRAWGTQREEYESISVFRVPLYPRGRGRALDLLLNYLSFIFSGLIFGPGLLRGRAYDAVFVYAPSPLMQALPALWLARRKKAPCVLWVQDLWPESLSATGFIRNRYALALVEWVVRFIYRHADRVLVPSEAFRAPIERLGVPSERINYYPNAYLEEYPSAQYSKDEEALAREIATGFSVVFAGNLGTAQALETVVEAAKLLQEQGSAVRFFLIGSGSRAAWVQAEVDRCGLSNLRLPGRFPNQAMPLFYAAAGALLVSLRDEPIFAYTVPSKVQGYLAAGRPVIASLNGEGARIIIEAGAGLACPAGDAESLARAVLELHANSAAERVSLGEAGRAYYLEYFESGKLARQLLGLLEAVKKQGGSR